MTHWSDGYIDIPHAQLDCAELLELVMREQFGKDYVFPKKERQDLFHRSALIAKHARDFADPIEAPYDGCGVMILTRGRMGHVGIYCAIDQGYVLHSDAAFGSSTRIPLNRMVPPRYRIQGFYAWK